MNEHTKKPTLEEIDKNMAVCTEIGEPDVRLYDVRQAPFCVYGLYNYKDEPEFKRMPDAAAEAVSVGVKELYRHTAGGRVRFATDSQYIAIRAEMTNIGKMSHFALTGSAGFDLFIDDPVSGTSSFADTFRPPFQITDGYSSKIKFQSRKMRCFTIHFPSYSGVKNLYIGLQADAEVKEGMPYCNTLPVVYYGSSITQGGCASRPGNIYQNIISRNLRLDYINLGFSGSGRAEDEMVQYLANLSMCAFVSDYDHNAPNAEYLKSTHEKLYRAVRKAHPDIPYIMLSRPDFDRWREGSMDRRDVVMTTFHNARADGDKNVYYIDGEMLFSGPWRDMCTVDGCHPTDLGFALMADKIGDVLKKALFLKMD